jgi:hypothetical protein
MLLIGPAENSRTLSTLATGIANSRSFVWTPSGSLLATSDAKYGLQLIDDVTGQFQYSTEFGLSKGPECTSSSVAVASSAASTASGTASMPPFQSTYYGDAPSSSFLSPGEKAAVAVCTIFGVAILVGIVLFACTRYNTWKARRPKLEPKAELNGAEEISELHHHDVRELDGRLMTELASQPISEMATQVAELEAV